MKLRVLGSAGAEFPDFRPPAFLIDDHLLLDAGTIGAVLAEEEQLNIRAIFVTHAHLDHIRGIPALADNLVITSQTHSVAVYSISAVIDSMKNHLFNGSIWPDFTCIPTTENPVVVFKQLTPGEENIIGQYSITAVPVNHTVPTVGYRVACGDATLVYTGDTGPTDEIWRSCAGVDALIVEVSFPNEMKELALLTKHLTVSLLEDELKKIQALPKRILITHPKPQYYERILAEVSALAIPGIELLRDGAVFEF